VPRPFPGAALPPGAEEAVTEPPAAVAHPELITTALRYRGVPYRNGGSDPSGFDCSGFIQYVFARFGTVLPREVRDQYHAGTPVDLDQVQAGDLLFFETVSRGASHVGMAVGGGEFVHAPSSRGVVRVERYDVSYWASRFVGARRVVATSESGGSGRPGAPHASD
jgi:cell wall-associated NlpC family hydrolase